MVGSGMLKGLDGIINFFIGCFIVAVIGIVYALWSWYHIVHMKTEIISTHKIIPALKLTIKENKVDTLYIYKQEK